MAMLHPTLTKLAKTREKLLAVVSSLSEDTLDRQSAEGWTIRETLTHLLNAEEDHCRVIAVIARGDADRLPRNFRLDEHNQRRLAERGRLTLVDLLAALAAQRQRTDALFNRLSDDQLTLTGPHPALGEMALGDIFRVIAIHEQAHTREIQALLDGMGG
jgi:uncharacterized damage-inducible protein DinB